MDERVATLPKILVDPNGEKITTIEQWEKKRRPEILELFREHVYGREPIQRPESLNFTVKDKGIVLNGSAQCKEINITFKGPGGEGGFRLLLYIPNHAPKPVPAFLFINNRDMNLDVIEGEKPSSFWPVNEIISRGYAAATFKTSDIDPDFHDEFQNGVHRIFDHYGESRPKNAWGTIAAWAWGARRAMDYLEEDSDIDANRVAVVGHSRGGKTALWAGALDERFAMVVSNNSGCTGAAISRGKKGESVAIINKGFPHWFAENYKNYNGKESELPIDQHMLLSLIAPRLLYVTSATEDEWADPESEFLSTILTTPVYELYGLKGLGTEQFPRPDSPIIGNHVGYHVRTGEHALVRYDWKCFMDFADQYL